MPLVPPLLSYSSTCSRTQFQGLGIYLAIGTLPSQVGDLHYGLSKICREPYYFTRLESCAAWPLELSKQTTLSASRQAPNPFRSLQIKPQRCYTAPHESRRNRRSCCQAAAGSTRSLPPLVHRIHVGPLHALRATRLFCVQTRPPRRPRVCCS